MYGSFVALHDWSLLFNDKTFQNTLVSEKCHMYQ